MQKNHIRTYGVLDATNESDFGLLAIPANKANVTLNVVADSNTIDCRGDSDKVAAIYAADNDGNPSDNGASDGLADIFLTATNNVISVEGAHNVAAGIVAGLITDMSYLPDEEHDFYLSGATITGNELEVDGSDSKFASAIAAELIRKETVISDNAIAVRGAKTQTMALIIAMGPISVSDNLLDVESNALTLGLTTFFGDNAAFAGYHDFSIDDVSSNIFNIVNPSGSSYGVAEYVFSASPANDVHKGSPTKFSDNNVFIFPSSKGLYLDNRFDGSKFEVVAITTIEELNAKTGFAADDPTVMSGNISVDPN